MPTNDLDRAIMGFALILASLILLLGFFLGLGTGVLIS
jgi:hypothetical protein